MSAACTGTGRSDHRSGVSRRRLLIGAAAGTGLLTTWRTGLARADAPAIGSVASATQPAHRIGVPPVVPTSPTTVAFDPPAVGEILFPLFLGAAGNCLVLDNFGDTRGRGNGYFHEGVDIMADENTPQLAVVDGELTKRYENTFWGWTLTGDDGVVYKYFHSTPDAAGWSVGDRVAQGDVIGFVGDSGTSPGNFHLHFEYRPNDVPADAFAKLQHVDGARFQT